MKKLSILFIFAIAIIACGKKGATASSTPPTPEESVWRTECKKCHGLKKPSRHTAAEWAVVVDRMQKKEGGNQFSDDQKAQIMKYLSANAGK